MITGYFHRKTGRLWIADEESLPELRKTLQPMLAECELICWPGIVIAHAVGPDHLAVTTVPMDDRL
jgi:hypothetical protein